MKILQTSLISLSGLGLLFIVACSNNPTATNSPQPTTPTVSSPSPSLYPTKTAATDHSAPNKGGQVVETENYHLELVALPEPGGTHLDFYLLSGDSHQSISNAQVTAQIESPNGEQKTVDLSYDSQGEHYAVFLPGETTGEYNVAILTDINGEKVNGRFNFQR